MRTQLRALLLLLVSTSLACTGAENSSHDEQVSTLDRIKPDTREPHTSAPSKEDIPEPILKLELDDTIEDLTAKRIEQVARDTSEIPKDKSALDKISDSELLDSIKKVKVDLENADGPLIGYTFKTKSEPVQQAVSRREAFEESREE